MCAVIGTVLQRNAWHVFRSSLPIGDTEAHRKLAVCRMWQRLCRKLAKCNKVAYLEGKLANIQCSMGHETLGHWSSYWGGAISVKMDRNMASMMGTTDHPIMHFVRMSALWKFSITPQVQRCDNPALIWVKQKKLKR